MREYGQIQCAFWTDPDVQSLSDQGKLLAAYLLSGPHSNGIGCYRLPDGYIQADFGWSSETVSKGFDELFAIGFANRCLTTFFVVIPNFLRWNPITNGNVAAARIKEFDLVPPKSSIYLNLIESFNHYGKHLPNPFINRLETLSKGYAKQDQEKTLPRNYPDPDPDPERDPTQPNPSSAVASLPTAALKKKRVQKTATQDQTPTAEIWTAYANAYGLRYGVTPVRNAKVNGMLKNLLDRLGTEESPPVAGFYVRHNRSLYVSAKHPVDLLLRDAEGLRTEWATGRTVTDTEARQTDRTQANGDVFNDLIQEARERERKAN